MAAEYVPAGHETHVVALFWLVADEYVPGGHWTGAVAAGQYLEVAGWG